MSDRGRKFALRRLLAGLLILLLPSFSHAEALQVTLAREGAEDHVNLVINSAVSEDERFESCLENGGACVFFFEGAGSDADDWERRYALCVVVRRTEAGDQIVYENDFSTTLPDRPKDRMSNGDKPVPTLMDGVYTLTAVTHAEYAALNVKDARVVRFDSGSFLDGYADTAEGIHIHRRVSNRNSNPGNSWCNSSGCLLVGRVNGGKSAEYNAFVQAVGLSGKTADFRDPRLKAPKNAEMGILLVDRELAGEYLVSLYGRLGAERILGREE
ncbi:MAG: hypothetical protein IJ174_01880 [Clostridia bacterium]|nr:hypothetical protein [Clostridia bacterium]